MASGFSNLTWLSIQESRNMNRFSLISTLYGKRAFDGIFSIAKIGWCHRESILSTTPINLQTDWLTAEPVTHTDFFFTSSKLFTCTKHASKKLIFFFSTDDKNEKEVSSNLALIVGVSVGAVVFVAVVSICVFVHCKRSASRGGHGRVGDGMPAEGGHSKAENYELKHERRIEGDFRSEEKGQLNEGMD